MDPNFDPGIIVGTIWVFVLIFLFFRSLLTRCPKCNSSRVKKLSIEIERNPSYDKYLEKNSVVWHLEDPPSTTMEVHNYKCKDCKAVFIECV